MEKTFEWMDYIFAVADKIELFLVQCVEYVRPVIVKDVHGELRISLDEDGNRVLEELTRLVLAEQSQTDRSAGPVVFLVEAYHVTGSVEQRLDMLYELVCVVCGESALGRADKELVLHDVLDVLYAARNGLPGGEKLLCRLAYAALSVQLLKDLEVHKVDVVEIHPCLLLLSISKVILILIIYIADIIFQEQKRGLMSTQVKCDKRGAKYYVGSAIAIAVMLFSGLVIPTWGAVTEIGVCCLGYLLEL